MIKYTNLLGDEITKQQKDSLDTYVKVYLDSAAKTIKEEVIQNGSVLEVEYFVSSQTEINNILLTDPNGSFSLEYNILSYSFIEGFRYENGILFLSAINVINSLGQLICYRQSEFDNLGNVISEITNKTFYENEEEKYEFGYASDGSCSIIHNTQHIQSDINPDDIGDLTKTNFSWAGFEYYKLANPINPDNVVV